MFAIQIWTAMVRVNRTRVQRIRLSCVPTSKTIRSSCWTQQESRKSIQSGKYSIGVLK